MSEGWKCPGCGNCYSPYVSECGWCNEKPQITTTFPHVTTTLCQCAFPTEGNTAGKCGLCGLPKP